MKTIKTLSPFKNICMTIGNLPSSYLESMSYYECLIWLCSFLEKEVIPTVNNNSEVVKELQEYVTNYFKNLDIQEEINTKLDEMAESGKLAEIIAQYLSLNGLFAFNTIDELSNATNLSIGSLCRTIGTDENDGLGNIYKIRQITSTDIIDNYNIVKIENDNTLIAERQNGLPIGKLSDLSTNNKNSIVSAINELKTNIEENTERIENSLDLHYVYDIVVAKDGTGDYTSLTEAVENANNGDSIFVKSGTYDDEVIKCGNKKLYIEGDNERPIIRNSRGDYQNPALEISKGVVSNLQFIHEANTTAPGSSAPYCVHIDFDYETENLTFNNCEFSNNLGACVGVGLRPNYVLTFNNCIMWSTYRVNSDIEDIGALFVHNSANTQMQGINQYIRLYNCELVSKYGVALRMQSCYGLANRGELIAENTTLFSEQYGHDKVILRDKWNNTTNVYSMLLSNRNKNNSAVLNTSTYFVNKPQCIDKFLNNQLDYPIMRVVKTFDTTAGGNYTLYFNDIDPKFGGFIGMNASLRVSGSPLELPIGYDTNDLYFRYYLNHTVNCITFSASTAGNVQCEIIYWAEKPYDIN